MTAREIINEIASSKEYRTICKRVCNNDPLWLDLFQDLTLILLEKEESTIESIYNQGAMKFFVVGILQNQFNSKTSPFFKKNKDYQLRNVGVFVSEDTNEPHYILDDILQEEVGAIINDNAIDEITNFLNTPTDQRDYYRKTLFKEALEIGSIRKLSAKTGISRNTISRTIIALKEEIKTLYGKDLYSDWDSRTELNNR